MSGNLLTPNRPAFCAYRSGPSGNVDGIMPLDGAFGNSGSWYNTSTYRFTVPTSGIYQIAITGMTSNVSTAISTHRLYKNGYVYSYTHAVGGHPASAAIVINVLAQAGDYFEYYGNVAYVQTLGSAFITTFSAHLIG
jgi:hypothetical protein